MRFTLVLFYLVYFGMSIQSQTIKVDTIISTNKIASYNFQKLILIDFWATWCMPCVPATRQLEILQESVSDKMYIVSMTDERADIVSKYLVKKPIKLAVYSDVSKNTIHRFNIQSRPYAVLLDYTGKVLWTGKPSDLTLAQIDKFHSKITGQNRKKITEIFEVLPLELKPKEIIVKEVVAINSFKFEIDNNCIQAVSSSTNNIQYCGLLSKIVSENLGISEFQIDSNEWTSQKYQLTISKDMKDSIDKILLINHMLRSLNLRLDKKAKTLAVKELKIMDRNMLWDTSQMNWGLGSPKFLIGTSRLQADNITIQELTVILSQLTRDKYIYTGTDKILYDWDFTYVINTLMKEELESSFGIKISETNKEMDTYSISKLE